MGEQRREWIVGGRSLSMCVGIGWAHESQGVGGQVCVGNEWARRENSTKPFCKCKGFKKISIGPYKEHQKTIN